MFSRRRAKALDMRKQRPASVGVLLPPLGGGFGGCSQFWVGWFSGYPAERLSWGVAPYPIKCYALVTLSLLTKR